MDAERARELLNRERQRIERALVEQAGGNDGELSTIDQHLGDQGSELYEDEFEAGGSRGGFMMVHPQAVPRDLLNVVDLLVPELQRRGLFRKSYQGNTLRENLAE